ncbi:DUF1329 domain-containing protein [Sinimarinibacterium sp. NLF-5-8]|uniref:DUF1329 domain-containing protein n=1 Tax=Sinimarinibacterium sp. NLF-5-8 TaxID=2698684 RepID=UPI00137B98FA|nr:DUF1329 domain-containing protein [Sinimarinibacterium sp. NLF-5-8]QHS11113.1 DUF1329 domain-containing protein [Sinimarinibacterium sp. NLF-5-8]
MRIRKYDVDYGRRKMMQSVLYGLGAGVLMPWEKVLASGGSVTKAYPDELLSIEVQSKGKVKVGDYITKDNVEYVKHLLDPGAIEQITGPEGRKIRIKAPTLNPRDLVSAAYYDATEEDIKSGHKGKFDADGNVVDENGKRWSGGLPFVNPTTGVEVWANMCLNIGRADNACYVIEQKDYGATGKQEYHYNFQWVELNSTARNDRKVFRGLENELRRQCVFFAASQDVRGTSFLSIWDYDMRKIPQLYGYLPEFRRVRQFPSNQRFEPLVPGATWFLSDPWAAGDPYLTWGNHKIIERKPMLGAWSSDFSKHDENWEPPRQKDNPKFFDIPYEMAPEVIVTSCEPVGYPRSPVSKRVAYVDARNGMAASNIRYDRQGKIWSNFEMAHGQFIGGGADGKRVILSADGKNPAWSWTYVHIYDFQNRRMSLCNHSKGAAGIEARFQADPEWLYETYCTQQALQQLGRA